MTKNPLRILLATIFPILLAMTFFASPAQALEVPADWKFKKISTPHFDVLFDARQQALGEHYARQAEKAFAYLSPVFSVTPAKTLIIINDKTDSTNGYATRVPYPHIMIYPVLPGPNESLSESGDWSFELIAHEYTHILTFEPATGFFKVLRSIFGSVLAPNLLLPNWWKEGLAVHIESSLEKDGGRSKSIYQDATLRAMASEGSLRYYTIDTVNDYVPEWPEGMRAYLFGSLFWTEAVQKAGIGSIDRLNIEHSGRIPYMLNGGSQAVLKTTYEDVYADAINETDRRAQAQIETLKKSPLTPLQPLAMEAKYSSAPAISANGKYMALITVDYKSDRVMEIFVRDPETKTLTKSLKVEIKSEEVPLSPDNNPQNNLQTPQHDGPPSGSIQKIAWFHHSPKLVFDQLHYVNRIERYSDLSIYDLTTQKTKRLTKSLRAREPSVSFDDTKIVFVKLEGGRTQLGLFDIAKETSEILFTPELQDRISSPVFVDSDSIVFAIRNSHGQEQLRKFSVSSRKVSPLLTSFPQARFPVLTKRGLMFTSSLNGSHNVYLASNDLKSARPVSHVVSMASSSALDPETEQLYTTVMTAKGSRVHRIEKADWEKTPASLPKIEPLFADRFAKTLTPAADYTPATTFETTDYTPGAYLWPQYWIPFLWTSPEGGLVLQAVTSGFDPLQKHSYSAMVGWDTYARSADWSFGYLNNVTSLPVQFVAAQSHSYLVTRDQKTEDSLVALSVLPEVWKFSEKTSVELGWRYLERSLTGLSKTKRTGPFGNFIYRNITQGGEQFTPQKGYGGYLAAAHYIEGQELTSHSQYQAGGVFYFSKFLPKLHAMMFRASAIHTPENIGAIFGAQSDSLDYTGNDLSSKFLIRGYSSGQFIGRNMYNASFEYRFPVKDLYYGSGTTPFFWRRVWGAAVVDGLATDGFIFDLDRGGFNRVATSNIFWSYGLEAHIETTIGYEFPVNAVIGLYQGDNKQYAPNPNLGIALQLGGF